MSDRHDRLIMIAGGVRSGKTKLAREIAARYDGVRVSFGDVVRERTLELGLPDERQFWQQVGEQWVGSEPESLCQLVMAPTAGWPVVVVDGVRHVKILGHIQASAKSRQSVLIFVDTAIEVRRARLASDQTDDGIIVGILGHSTESELPFLLRAADFVVDGTRDYSLVLPALDAFVQDGR